MNPSRLFLASCMALIVTAMSFAIRGDTMTEIGATFRLDEAQLGWIAGTAFWGFTLAMVFIIAAIASDDFPVLFHFLDAKPLVFLGNVSYSFYLLHPFALATVAVTLCSVTPIDFPQKHFVIAALLVAVFSILLAVPLAQISFLLLEKPFLRRR